MQDTQSTLGLWLSFVKTYRRVQNELAQNLEEAFSLSLPQFQVLAQLAGHPQGRRMSDLAEALLMTNGNATGLVKRLGDKGWVQTQTDPDDKRATRVLLSAKGKTEFEIIKSRYEEWVEHRLGHLSGQEKHNLREILRKMRPEPQE